MLSWWLLRHQWISLDFIGERYGKLFVCQPEEGDGSACRQQQRLSLLPDEVYEVPGGQLACVQPPKSDAT